MNFLRVCLIEFNCISVMIRIILAVIIGGLIGLERGRHGRAAGLRTHILVCVGAAITSLTSLFLSEHLRYSGDVARLSAQVVSGIGFLGAGMILIRNNSMITGLTTAAGMWTTAVIGIAVGYGFYSAAGVSTVFCVFCVTVLNKFERKRRSRLYIYIELTQIAETERAVQCLKKDGKTLVSYDIIPAKSGHVENLGIVCVVSGEALFEELKQELCRECSVAMILCDIQ